MLDGLTVGEIRQLLDHANLGILLFDAEGRACDCNPALSQWLGEIAVEMIGQRREDLAGGPLAPLLEADGPVQVSGPDGTPRFLEVRSITLDNGQDGRRVEALLYRDVTAETQLRTQVERLTEALQAEATSDPDTGLLNRRGLLLALEPQVARSRRYERPLSVIVVEVGGESGPGPWLGDASRLLKDQLRWADLVGHAENGQFVVALPETDSEHAQVLAVKLRSLLGDLAGQDGAAPQVRIGVSSWRRSDNATALLRRAAEQLSGDRAQTCAVAS